MQPAAWILLLVLAAILAAWGVHWLLRNPRGDLETGLVYRLMQVYSRLYHGLKVSGREHIPRSRNAGPLIVVANHTAGVDPVLIQAACPFEIRWIMASNMRLPQYDWFWDWAKIISVHRTGRDLAGAREAIRHLKNGGVLGVFPEGGLERPAESIMPFLPGAGFIIAHTEAKVLPVIISGTPAVDPAWASLWVPSRSRLRFGPMLSFGGRGLSAAEITQELHTWFIEQTGWPESAGPVDEPALPPAPAEA